MYLETIYLKLKQIFDFIFALCLTVCLSPVLLILAIIIKLDSKGPVLFKQKRIGKDNVTFDIYKFRTMRTDTPKDMPTHILDNPERFITGIGKFLRKSSLDELPQLFNILNRQMSFIGPRPALWNQYDLIEMRSRLGVDHLKPGITGWAQVNGRDELAIDVKVELDGYYANHICFKLDFKIFIKTVAIVLSRKGVSEGGPSVGRPSEGDSSNGGPKE